MTDILRARTCRAALAAALILAAMVLSGCAAPYSTGDVNKAFSALPGVDSAEVVSKKQPPNPVHHSGKVTVSSSISVEEYSAALMLTRDYPKLSWSVGDYGSGNSSFGMTLDSDSDPDHFPVAAAWVKAAAELDGVARSSAYLYPDSYSEATARLALEMADDGSAPTPLALLTDLDALTSPLPYAGLEVSGEDISVRIAPYDSAVLDALRQISALATIRTVDDNCADGEGGMLGTVAKDAEATAVQQLADQNRDQWGTVTVLGPYDDFDIYPGDPSSADNIALVRKLQALPEAYNVDLSAGTVYIRHVTLDQAALIDEQLSSDPIYRNASVSWILKDADALQGLHKPAGQDLVIDALAAAAQVNGVEELRTTKQRFYDYDDSDARDPGARVEITAARSDFETLMHELRAAGIGELNGMEAQFTVSDPQGGLIGQANATINAEGDLVDLVGDGRGDVQGLVDAWNDAN